MEGTVTTTLNEKYRQALKELERARCNYDETSNDFEGVAYHELRAAEDRVMAIIKERKEV